MSTYHVALGGALHGDLGVRVDSEASVEDSVRDLVAEFVGVALTDRFRCEVDMS